MPVKGRIYRNNKSQPKIITNPPTSPTLFKILNPLVFFLPSLLYYSLDARYRNFGFVAGAVICLQFFRKLMLGSPTTRSE